MTVNIILQNLVGIIVQILYHVGKMKGTVTMILNAWEVCFVVRTIVKILRGHMDLECLQHQIVATVMTFVLVKKEKVAFNI